MYKKRICKYCNTIFKRITSQKFASHVCHCDKNFNKNKEAWKQKISEALTFKRIIINKKCKVCNAIFQIKRTVNKLGIEKIHKKEKQCCSNFCSRSIAGNSIKIMKLIEAKCYICKKIFKTRPINKSYGFRLCSICKTSKNIEFLKLKKLGEIKKCLICDKEFKTLKSRFCSKKCIDEHNSKLYTVAKRQKISEQQKELYRLGIQKVGGGKTPWYSYKKIRVQGTYELRVCKILDKLKSLKIIKKWEYTKDRFQYIGIDNTQHSYLVDFKIFRKDGTFTYLEVKGFKKENDDLKWKSVLDSNYRIKIWFNKQIKYFENKFLKRRLIK